MATDYLTVADVAAMHEMLITRYGGAAGVRDMGALESALFRPQSGYYDNIATEAAALMESLAINHPFVDGNKRVAFAATDVFLRINGYHIRMDPMKAHAALIRLFESQQFDLKHIDAVLRGAIVKAK